MRIKNEDEILDIGVRKKIIEEINGPENRRRKNDHYMRHMIYKDRADFFVQQQLLRQFDQNTVQEMQYALSNVSLFRKVIDKLARVYSQGVTRTVVNEEGVENEEATETMSELETELDFNTHMKTANRYLKAHRNTDVYVKPCPTILSDGTEKINIVPQVLAPYLYDVVEDFYNRSKPMVYILSNFDFNNVEYSKVDAAREGRNISTVNPLPLRDNQDQTIADRKEDEGKDKKEYIWWTDKYHFTTDETGAIISGEEIQNPILKKPFVNFAIDRDNSFWAIGGDDLANAGILVNSMITHINHVGVTQGYGQLWMKGKNLPRNIAVGPNKAILLEYEENEPVPDVGFATSSPPLNELMRSVEMYVALVLTTNNLSTSGVATQLTQAQGAASGIALLIDKSESMEDVQDQRQVFIDNEPLIWELISDWISYYSDQVVDNLKGKILPENFDLNLQFLSPQVLQTEAEKLANIEKRKDLGLNTMAELVRIDQPDLNDEQAEEKLKKIMDEKKSRMEEMTGTNQEEVNADDAEDESNEQDAIQ